MSQKLTTDQKIQAAEYIRDTYLPIPHYFIKDMLGCDTWNMQDEIVKSVFKYKYTAVKTCNSIGKSYIAARIVLTYLSLYPNSIVVTTAPTWSQVTDVLWREIATAVELSKFKLTDKEVNQAGLNISAKWYAVGRSTKRPQNFFGYHADRILVVVDEAGGVDPKIFLGVDAITTNVNARVLLIGNPTDPVGKFYEAFTKPTLGYNCFTVSAFQTPNFTANNIQTVEDLIELYTPPQGVLQADHNARVLDKLVLPYDQLIDPQTVIARYYEYGTDSAGWQALTMGEFPTEADQALIPANLITMAMHMTGVDNETGETYADMSGWDIPEGPFTYGVDMARFGSDSTVVTTRHGGWVEKQMAWNKVDLMTSADRILTQIDPLNGAVSVNIDDTGNGGGTTDRLRQISKQETLAGRPNHQYVLNAYNFSSKEFMSDADKNKYHDITSMLYWNLRAQFIKHRISLPNDQQLKDELISRRWTINKSTGKIQVESKDDYKKRTGGKSPDRSDSLALAFAPRSTFKWPDKNEEERDAYTRNMDRPITSSIGEQRY